jgi:hypothetical protein
VLEETLWTGPIDLEMVDIAAIVPPHIEERTSIGDENRTSSIGLRTCQLNLTFGLSRRSLGWALATYHPAGNPAYQRLENKATFRYVSGLPPSSVGQICFVQLHTSSSVYVPCTGRRTVPHLLRITTGTSWT